MTEEEQQRVFGAFERLSNAVTKDGFGLGLSIVQRIVAMLGGTIRLESEKGKGSRFTVEIPMQVAEELTKQAVQDYVRHNERYRDLLRSSHKSFKIVLAVKQRIVFLLQRYNNCLFHVTNTQQI